MKTYALLFYYSSVIKLNHNAVNLKVKSELQAITITIKS